jgi:hypothetical protein
VTVGNISTCGHPANGAEGPVVGHAKTVGNIGVLLTALGCLAALTISVFPGVLDDLLFLAIFVAVLAIPIILIGGVLTLIVLARRGKLKGVTVLWRHFLVAALIVAGSLVLLTFYVPRRIAFAASRSAFEELVSQAHKFDHQGTPLNKRLGVYYVDEYAADPRGGVYFRVHTGPDGIGPDQMSYGFAYMPNSSGTPFGAARYEQFRLSDGWYWFCASNDWF